MNKKVRIGIDIDEVLRAKWLQFDRFYAQEFGEEGIPEEPYSYDFFNDYAWSDVVEKTNILTEDVEMLENITPMDYQPDEEGNVVADIMLFNTEEIKLTAKEVYERFMYVDFCFEIFGTAPQAYKGLDYHFNEFYKKYRNFIDIIIVSNENKMTIPPTLFFLSKMTCRADKYILDCVGEEKFKDVDILITADPEILVANTPKGKRVIKIERPFNMGFSGSELEVIQLFELVGNKEFEKLIKYKE